MKTVKQQLKEELRTAISERKRLLELRNRSDLSKTDKLALAFATTQPSLASTLMKGRSETDLKALTSGYLDPNTATNVSNLLNAQSNDYSFLNSRSSFLVDDVALKTEASSSQSGVRHTAGEPRLQEHRDKLRVQKSLDSYLNDPHLDLLRSSMSTKNFDQPAGQTMTTTTFINSPINLSNYNSTFSSSYLKDRLETGLSGRLENPLRETTIQETSDRRQCRSSMSQSLAAPRANFSAFSRPTLKPSLSTEYRFQDGLLDHELLGLDFKTTKFGDGLLPVSFYENQLGNAPVSNENQDGKTV